MNDQQPSEKPKRTRTKLSPGYKLAPPWMRHVFQPTDAQKQKWAEAGLPPDDEIAASALHGFDVVWGVPDKAEIFRLADEEISLRKELEDRSFPKLLPLRVAEPSMLPGAFRLLHAPIGPGMSDQLYEHNYLVHVQVLTHEIYLAHLKVISGSRSDDSKEIVFEGTEYPGPALRRQVRVIRVTVHEHSEGSYATFEVLAETTYPRSFI